MRLFRQCSLRDDGGAPVPAAQHGDAPALGSALGPRQAHLGHAVPALGVPRPELTVLVPPEGPENVALGQTDGVSGATVDVHHGALGLILPP